MSMFEIEKRALTGDREAVIRVVSALRMYRAAAEALFERGMVDSLDISIFKNEIREIESND